MRPAVLNGNPDALSSQVIEDKTPSEREVVVSTPREEQVVSDGPPEAVHEEPVVNEATPVQVNEEPSTHLEAPTQLVNSQSSAINEGGSNGRRHSVGSSQGSQGSQSERHVVHTGEHEQEGDEIMHASSIIE